MNPLWQRVVFTRLKARSPIPVMTISYLLFGAAQSAWVRERLHEEVLQASVEIEHHKHA